MREHIKIRPFRNRCQTMGWQTLPQTDIWKPILRNGKTIWQHQKSKVIIYFDPEKLENADNFIVCIDTNAVIV